MQIDAIGVGLHAIALFYGRGVHADVSKPQCWLVSFASIVVYEATDHKDIIARTNLQHRGVIARH